MYVNWLDLLIGGILIFSLIGAVRNGVTKEILRLVSLALGVVAAMWQYPRLAAEYAPYVANPSLANFAAFGSIIVGFLVAGAVLAWILVKIWGAVGLRWFDRLLGAAFGLIRGLAVAAVLVLGLLAFAPVDDVESVVARSRLAPWVLHGARIAAMAAPREFHDAYASGLDRVRRIWNPPAEDAPEESAVPLVRASPFTRSD